MLCDGHGDFFSHGVNRQVALDLGDVVVASLSLRAIEDNVELVLRGTLIGLRPGVGVRDAGLFACNEATRGHAGFSLGQGSAIIGLRCGARRDGDVFGRNGELAGRGGHRELRTHIVAAGVLNSPVAIIIGAGDGLGVLASVLTGDVGLVVLNLELNAVNLELIGYDARHGLVGTVIGLGAGNAFKHDLVLGSAIRNRQRTVGGRDVVVVEVGAILGRPTAGLNRALRGANNGLRAFDGC